MEMAFDDQSLLAMSQEDRHKFLEMINPGRGWMPMCGPQTAAYYSDADELFYGGAAGGGKTDLVCGLAHTIYRLSIIYRRQSTQLTSIIDRLKVLIGDKGYNGQDKIFRVKGRQIELGSVNNHGDEQKYQGRPHELKVFDEITHFTKYMYQFLCGWTRPAAPGAPKCRIICTGNPPTNSDGQWVKEHWGPWLDPDHPNPAKPGELRYFTTVNGKEVERPNGDEFEFYDEKKKEYQRARPKSRTFIPAKVQDNPYLIASGYEATLQAMPEPLRSQMLFGDFQAGSDDDPWQVIPTAWVEAAMARWKPMDIKPEMDSMGIDTACGGKDETVISCRHGAWFDKLHRYPGAMTPNGPVTAGLVLSHRADDAPMHVDVIGWGVTTYDSLVANKLHTVACNGAEATKETTKKNRLGTGVLRFYNKRALLHWRMREVLDPANNMGIALHPDPKLKADLVAAKWELTPRGILIESKDDIKLRLGRSPDSGDAVMQANICTPKINLDDDDQFIPTMGSAYA